MLQLRDGEFSFLMNPSERGFIFFVQGDKINL